MTGGGYGGETPDGVGQDPLARLRWAMAEVERMSAAQAAGDADRAERTAAAARRGDLGPQWQRVQERVDRGETSLTDVFSGKDSSPEAVALARRSREHVGELLGSVREAGDPSLDDAFDALDGLRARIATVLGDVRPSMPGEPPPAPTRPAWRDPR